MVSIATVRTVASASAAPASFWRRSSTLRLLGLWSFIAASFCLVGRANAQTYLSEDFESGLPSANFTLAGSGQQWSLDTTYKYAGSKAARFHTAGASNGYLVSKVLNLSAATSPILSFYHIAAIEKYFDQAYVEVSSNGGLSWSVLTNTQYNGNSWRKTGSNLGAGSTYPDGPYFDAMSRPEWDIQLTTSTSTPTTASSMWVKEVFDLSAFKSAAVQIRFRVKSNASGDWYGWLLDNVSVTEAPSTRMAGVRVIGSGGFADFRAATQALADSGVGAGGVTFLVSPGTYTDSLNFGYWRGVNASNRVRFKGTPGTVAIQRMGTPRPISQPSYSNGWTYTYQWDAVLLMSGSQYTTLDGITLQQQNGSTTWNTDVGLYMTNGCKYDSVVNCTMNMSTKYYTTTGFMLITNQYTSAPYAVNVANRFVNDTVLSWNGAVLSSQFTTAYDSLNEISGTSQGGTFFNLGPINTSPSSYSTMYCLQFYGQSNLLIKNIKETVSDYGTSIAAFTTYGMYSGGNLYLPVITNNLLTNFGATNPSSYLTYNYGIYLPASNIFRPKITNNTFSDWYGYYNYYCIYMSSSSIYEPLIQGNTATRLQSRYYGTYCMYFGSVVRPRVIGNRIKDIRLAAVGGTSSSTFYGMYFSSVQSPCVIYNNMISDVSLNYATSSSFTLYGMYFSPSPPAVTGIGAVRDSICHNSIYFSDTHGSGTSYPYSTSYAFYFVPSTTTGYELHIYNNIFSNRQSNGTSSVAWTVYRSSTSGTVFMDYNDLYGNTVGSGTDAIHRTGYYGGTTCYTLSDWKTASTATNDRHSFAELPPWNSSDSLHIASGTATRLESAGKYLASVTTDFDGDARSTAPDIGADEASLTMSNTDDVGPAITPIRVPKTTGSSGVTVSAYISDQTAVATGSSSAPRMYYRVVPTLTWSSVTGVAGSNNLWTFTTSTIGAGSIVQFYLAAQDTVTVPNVSTMPVGGSGSTPPGSTAPATYDTIRVIGPLSGDYLIGGTTPNFPTLKAALDSLDLVGISGPVRFLINTSSLVESGQLAIIGPILGSSATNTVTIKPNTGITATITPSFTTNSYGILINGASNIIIDGSNTNGGTTRDLTFSGGSTSSTTANLIQFFVQPALGNTEGTKLDCRNLTFKNLILRGGYNTPSASSDYGILLQGNAPYVQGGQISDVTITNNVFSQMANGVRLLAQSPDYYLNPVKRVSITNNLIGAGLSGTDSIWTAGILMQGVDSVTIDHNDISNLLQGTFSNTLYGIQLATACTNVSFTNNKIHNVRLQASSGAMYGIYQSSSFPPATNSIFTNNYIYDFHQYGTSYSSGTSSTSPAAAGIFIAAGGGDLVAYNTVHFADSITTNTTTNSQYTEAIGFSSSAYNTTVVNNILSNGLMIGPKYGLNIAYMSYYGSAQLGMTNNNILYAPGINGAIGYSGQYAMPIYDVDSLRSWNGGDGRSFYHSAPFTSKTDPHILTGVQTRVEAGGIPVAGVTTDFDGDTRNATTPDIGADEGNFSPVTSGINILVHYVTTPQNNLRYVVGSGFRAVVTLRNDGGQTAFNVPVIGAWTDSVTSLTTQITSTVDSIRPGGSRTITMDSLTVAAARTYFFRVYSNATGDTYRYNDTSGIYRIVGVNGLSGIYTVGVGRWAPTIKAAFDSLAIYGLAGPTTFSLTDASYQEQGITTGYVGNGGLVPGANAINRLRLKPATGVSPVLDMYGNTSRFVSTYAGTYYPAFGITNTSYLTIDGSNTENGTSRNMTIRFHPYSSGAAAIVLNGGQFDSIKNCIVWDSTYYSTMSGSGFASYGVVLSSPTAGVPQTTSYNVIDNNQIRDNYYGVYAYGNFPWYGVGNVVSRNDITRFTYAGLYSVYQQDFLYQYNKIQSDTIAYVNNLYGMYISGSSNASYGRIDGNRIWKFRAYNTPSYTYMYGLYLQYSSSIAGNPTTVSNNLIAIDHDTSTDWVYLYGVYRYTSQAMAPVNMYFNTIYTGGTGSYTYYYTFQDYYGFGDVKNNVIENRRPSQYLLYDYNYNSSPQVYNNNLMWYCGTLGTFYLYYNGPSGYSGTTFAQWQASSGMDSKGWSEPQTWQDSVGGNFAPITTLATRIESHGVPIPGITTDINGNPRNARYPDIGAFEGNYISKFDVNLSAVSMDQPVPNTRYFPGTSITASATFKQSGLTTVASAPIVYQAIDPSGTVQATSTPTLTSLAPNVNTSAGNFVFTPVTPGIWTIRAFANHASEEYTLDDTVAIQIRVLNPMQGTYTVGVGQYAPTMKAALDSLQFNGIKGPVVFQLTDNAYSEPSLTANIPMGQAPATSVTFKPAPGKAPVVTFNPTVSTPWGIRLNSVTNYAIDGSNTAGGTTRDLKLQMANSNGQAVVWVSDSLGGSGSSNATIKNTKIYSGGTSSSYFGICASGTTIGSSGSNNGLVVQNNEIRNAGIGICASGLATTPNTGSIFTQNTIGPAVGDNTNRIGVEGIRLTNVSAPTVTNNEIMGLYSTANSVAGINFVSGVSAATVQKNKIHDIEAKSSSYRALGVLDNSGGASQYVNNMIWHVTSGMANTTSAGANAGIMLGSTSGATLYFNSIYLSGNRDTVAATSGVGASAALYVSSGASGVVSKNNIYASKQTEVTGGAKSYGAIFENATSVATADNDMFSGLGTKAGLVGRVGSTDYLRMADLRGGLGSREANGFGADVLFVSDADLHINPLVPSLIEGGATPIAGVTTDIDGDTRNAVTPDVGADEGSFSKAVDIVAVSIDNPLNNSVYRPFSTTTAPVVTFRNAATGTGTNIPVTFVTIDSLVSTRTVSNRTIPTLGPNASTQVTFDSLVLPDIGKYGIYAYANYGFDVDNTNDTTSVLTVKVCAPMFGTYYIGAGRDFSSLALAAKTLHDCGVQTQVNMYLTDNSYNETTPIVFTGITGLTSANSVTIRPNPDVNPVMNITTQAGTDYGILLDSVNWISLDGSNVAGGTTRNWRINLTGPSAAVNAIALRDGSRDQIRNLAVRSVAMTAGTGVLVQPTRVKMTGTVISNNDISNTQTGIMVAGSAIVDSNLSILNNTITRWAQTGIQVGDMAKTLMIRGNTVRSDTTATTTAMTGIQVSGANTTDVEIGANKVMDFNTSGTNPVLTALSIANTGATATRVYDNMLSLGRQTSLPTASMYGVQLLTGASARLQNNTIAIGGTANSGFSYDLYVNAPVNVTMYNNLFTNARTNASGATGKHYGFFSQNAPTGVLTSDYNDWNVTGSGGALGQALGVNLTTLPMWRMFSNGSAWGMQDRNSYNENPSFVGASDLHLTTLPSRAQNGGKPGLTGPTGQQDYDIDGTVRSYIADVGATEFDGPRNARLKGTYTIGDSTSAYATLSAAVAALNTNGVDGPVDFYLSRTTENISNPIRFVAADGIGSNWPVRIHAAAGYTSAIVGASATTANMPAVIIFDSAANNITIDGDNGTNDRRRSLWITNQTPGYANSVIVLTNGANNDAVRNSGVTTRLDNVRINPETDGFGVISVLGGYYGGFVANNVIENDSIANGANGVYAYAPNTNWQVTNLLVKSSNISDFNASGIMFGPGTTQSFASGNYITTNVSPGSAPTVRGIRVSSDDYAATNGAGYNWIINLRSNGSSNVSGIDLTDGQRPMIFNNFISLNDYTTGSVRGIDEASSSTTTSATGARIFFNSINLYGDKNPSAPTDYALAILTPDGAGNADSVVDNIFAIHRNAMGPNALVALGIAQFSDVTYADNNDYYTPQSTVGQVGLISYATLPTLRAAPSWSLNDANSITGDPVFKSNLDLHLGSYNSAAFNKGKYLTSVTTDIDYQSRDLAPKTEIGADENGFFGTLPIELMSLEARGLNKQVDLTFATANESNVYGFVVLRSDNDDKHFVEIANASNDRSLVARGTSGRTTDYTFVDNSVTNGKTYYYQIGSIDNDGSRKQYEKVAVATPNAPVGFAIENLYPNPYSLGAGEATISYSMSTATELAQLTITDITGHTVRALLNGPVEKAGSFTAQWDGKDDNGVALASGTYFVTLRATIEGSVQTTNTKIVLAK